MQNKSLLYRLWWLFKANIIISCLAVGGGYVIIPLVKKEFIDKNKALDFDELIEMYAIAQSAPGAIATNLSAIVGYKVASKTPEADGSFIFDDINYGKYEIWVVDTQKKVLKKEKITLNNDFHSLKNPIKI